MAHLKIWLADACQSSLVAYALWWALYDNHDLTLKICMGSHNPAKQTLPEMQTKGFFHLCDLGQIQHGSLSTCILAWLR